MLRVLLIGSPLFFKAPEKNAWPASEPTKVAKS
jgi:hypothetical protein